MRLADQPEPFAVVVVVPGANPGDRPVTQTLNGRVAKMIAFLLDKRFRIEVLHTGRLAFNLGPHSFKPELNETFPQEATARSVITAGRGAEAPSTETFPEIEHD